MTPVVNLDFDLEIIVDKVFKQAEYIMIKCHIISGKNNSGSCMINIFYYDGGKPEMRLLYISQGS